MRRLLDGWLSAQAARPRGALAPLVGRWLERENAAGPGAALAARPDAALAVNAVYFWRPPLAGLRELRRVLRPGGRLVLGLEAPGALGAVGETAAAGFVHLTPGALGALCAEAGFGPVAVAPVAALPPGAAYYLRAAVPPGAA